MTRNTYFRKPLRTLASAAAVTVGALVVSTAPASSASAAAAQPTCGSVITTSITLTRDLSGCTANGLVVGADGITIDLGGHRVSGTGAFTSLAGVYNDGYDDVVVRNGQVTDFSQGVQAYASDRNRYESLSVRRTLIGIDVTESAGVLIKANRLVGNREGLALLRSHGTEVVGNTIDGNTTQGATDRDSIGSTYRSNSLRHNGFSGLSLSAAHGATVADNLAARNGLDGVEAYGGTAVTYLRNTLTGNDDNGLLDSGDGSTFGGNRAYDNGAVGLLADGPGVIDLGGNRAARNGEANCIGLSCR